MTKWVYLGLWASNEKNKTTLFPETLKVEENKVVLFFLLKAPRRIYEGFFVSSKILYYKHFFQLKTHLSK